ncbi:hypothetical protein VKT23_015563 [Stygiomarasmius scandens]|uniref:Uncharacterized protein n=1 Tax=Marasmiellus scandens TaxID=2682957 RepID=A0ABR1J1V2_9AGAR
MGDVSSEILDLTDELKESVEKIRSKSAGKDLKDQLGYYLQDLYLISELVKWDEVVSYSADFPTDLNYDSEELDRLRDEFNEANQVIFDDILEQSNGNIPESTDVDPLQQKFDNRIEIWFLPFLLDVLQRHEKIVSGDDEDDSDKDDSNNGETIPEILYDQWYEMDITLTILLYEFHARMKSLLRGWRVQKLDPELQVDSYSGGVFAGWYEAYMNESKEDFQSGIKMLEDFYGGDSDDDSNEDEENSGKGDNNDTKAMDSEITELRNTVSEMQGSLLNLQESVAELAKMMKSIQLSINKGSSSNAMVRRIVTDAVNITDHVMDKDATEYESDGESSEQDYQDNVEEQDEQNGELGT